jgi:hypothetical protein
MKFSAMPLTGFRPATSGLLIRSTASRRTPRWNLYIGAAGTIWALRHLSGKPDRLPDFSSVVPRLLEPNHNWILNVKGEGLDLGTAGLLTADTGILLVHAMINGVETVAVPAWLRH